MPIRPRTTPVSTARCSGGRRCLCMAPWETAPTLIAGLLPRWSRSRSGRARCIGSSLGSLFRHALAQDSMRTEDQDHDEERESDEIAQLVGRGNADAVEEKRGAYGFDEAEEKAAEHGA